MNTSRPPTAPHDATMIDSQIAITVERRIEWFQLSSGAPAQRRRDCSHPPSDISDGTEMPGVARWTWD
jgi:hypothetical protein